MSPRRPAAPSIGSRRLSAQSVTPAVGTTPAEVVARLGAMQAQDYAGAKWAVGLRLQRATELDLEAALSEGSVLRTHAMRFTWQLVTPQDLPWILELVGRRVIDGAAGRYRELGLDMRVLRRSSAAIDQLLDGGAHLTRQELAEGLDRAGVPTAGGRLAHLLGHAELEGQICSGARRGKQNTYALLATRVPKSVALRRDEAVAELALRYFRSRGPATLRDFCWWSGLTQAEARVGIDGLGQRLRHEDIDGRATWSDPEAVTPRLRQDNTTVHLLPPFDEYLVAYRDREAVLDPSMTKRVNAGGGLLNPCVVIGGQVVGTWRRELSSTEVEVVVQPFAGTKALAEAGLERAAARYGAFLGLTARLVV